MHLSGRKGNEKFVKNDIAYCQKIWLEMEWGYSKFIVNNYCFTK